MPPVASAPGVAMREHARPVGDERRADFADAPAHRPIFLEDSRGFVAEFASQSVRVASVGESDLHHPIERASQVHRRRARAAQPPVSEAERGDRILSRPRLYEQGQPHRRRDADRRRAAHRERLDRLTDLVHRAQVQIRLALRKQTLVEDAHAVAILGPRHGLDRLHGPKRRFVVRPA